MKESNWLLSKIILVITLVTLCFTLSCQKQDVEADIAAIKEVFKQETLACSTGNVELYLSLFTEDVVMMATESPSMNGMEEFRPPIEGVFGMFDLKLPFTVDKVEVHGDWAFARSSFQYSMTLKEGGETTTRVGKALDIFKRQTDGSWKIYMECWNYDAPLKAE
jgi:uncharacterized protein (TIGR02246 family)